MKKIIFYLSICLLGYSVYYVYTHKNRFIYRISGSESETTNEQLDQKIKNLERQLLEQRALSEGLNEQISFKNDTIFILRSELKSLTKVSEAKPSVKIIKTQQNPLNLNLNKTTVKNETNNLPIARGRDAVQLKEFFTDRYDHR